jgi:hypothetical protein
MIFVRTAYLPSGKNRLTGLAGVADGFDSAENNWAAVRQEEVGLAGDDGVSGFSLRRSVWGNGEAHTPCAVTLDTNGNKFPGLDRVIEAIVHSLLPRLVAIDIGKG